MFLFVPLLVPLYNEVMLNLIKKMFGHMPWRMDTYNNHDWLDEQRKAYQL
ncbi:MAG: hypothetical protein ACI9LM_002295 [Alteromonadaceae bacterium]